MNGIRDANLYVLRSSVSASSIRSELKDGAGLDGLFNDAQADQIVHILAAIEGKAQPSRVSA